MGVRRAGLCWGASLGATSTVSQGRREQLSQMSVLPPSPSCRHTKARVTYFDSLGLQEPAWYCLPGQGLPCPWSSGWLRQCNGAWLQIERWGWCPTLNSGALPVGLLPVSGWRPSLPQEEDCNGWLRIARGGLTRRSSSHPRASHIPEASLATIVWVWLDCLQETGAPGDRLSPWGYCGGLLWQHQFSL